MTEQWKLRQSHYSCSQSWPETTQLKEKLYGDLAALQRTAAFLKAVGVDVWRREREEEEEEEEEEWKVYIYLSYLKLFFSSKSSFMFLLINSLKNVKQSILETKKNTN